MTSQVFETPRCGVCCPFSLLKACSVRIALPYNLRAIVQEKACRRPRSAVGEHQGNRRSAFFNLGTIHILEITLVLFCALQDMQQHPWTLHAYSTPLMTPTSHTYTPVVLIVKNISQRKRKKISRLCQVSSEEQKYPWLRTTALYQPPSQP